MTKGRQIWVLAGLLLAGAAQAAPTVLHTMMQEGSAPKFMESDGRVQGHCPDIFRALEKLDPQLRFDVDANPVSIKRLEVNLKEGRIDVICALLETQLRDDIAYRVSTPLFMLRERLVARKDEMLQIHSLKDLADSGAMVATQNGASYAAILRSKGVKVDESSGDSAVALRNLVNGRVRFYYTNELTGAYYIQATGLGQQLRLLPLTLQETPSYLWLSRKLDEATVQRIERALAQLQKDGTLERIYRSYANRP